MRLLSLKEMTESFGWALTTSAVLLYLTLAAGITGIIKVLFSSSGRITFSGMTFQWKR